MKYQEIKERVMDIERAVYGKIDDEADALKSDYLAQMQDNFEEEDAGYDDFDEYVESEADSFLDFAFGAWVEKLLEQLIGVTKADWEQLTPAECEQITQPFMDRFKELSGLGEVSEAL